MQAALRPTKSETTYTPAGAVTNLAYTGSAQTYTVPAGVTLLSVNIAGAVGGYAYNNGFDGSGTGGFGGRLTTVLPVTPGEVLNVYIGGAGDGHQPGWNGGGNGVYWSGTGFFSGGGGGATDIRRGGTALANRVLVAGGGGGGGTKVDNLIGGNGGDGGGLAGGPGGSGGNGYYAGGQGGTQSAGGAAGDNGAVMGTAGALGVGGNGADGYSLGIGYSGGGGGGYYGGGGGSCYKENDNNHNAGGGGGGSGYDSTGSGSFVLGYNSTFGYATLTPVTSIPAANLGSSLHALTEEVIADFTIAQDIPGSTGFTLSGFSFARDFEYQIECMYTMIGNAGSLQFQMNSINNFHQEQVLVGFYQNGVTFGQDNDAVDPFLCYGAGGVAGSCMYSKMTLRFFNNESVSQAYYYGVCAGDIIENVRQGCTQQWCGIINLPSTADVTSLKIYPWNSAGIKAGSRFRITRRGLT